MFLPALVTGQKVEIKTKGGDRVDKSLLTFLTNGQVLSGDGRNNPLVYFKI